MDINELYTAEAHEKGAAVSIINPLTGKKTDVVIYVKGVDSKAFRKAEVTAYRKALEANQSGEECDATEISADILASITTGWEGLTNNGEPLEFSEKLARDLYINAPPIRKQVDAFVADRANFTQG